MVVLFFAIGKNNFTFSTREFADYLKRSVVTQTDQKKVVALEVKKIKYFKKLLLIYIKLYSIAWNYERSYYEFPRFSS